MFAYWSLSLGLNSAVAAVEKPGFHARAAVLLKQGLCGRSDPQSFYAVGCLFLKETAVLVRSRGCGSGALQSYQALACGLMTSAGATQWIAGSGAPKTSEVMPWLVGAVTWAVAALPCGPGAPSSGASVPGYLQLHSEFEAFPGNVKLEFQKPKSKWRNKKLPTPNHTSLEKQVDGLVAECVLFTHDLRAVSFCSGQLTACSDSSSRESGTLFWPLETHVRTDMHAHEGMASLLQFSEVAEACFPAQHVACTALEAACVLGVTPW